MLNNWYIYLILKRNAKQMKKTSSGLHLGHHTSGECLAHDRRIFIHIKRDWSVKMSADT
jgi:hypothetical protein